MATVLESKQDLRSLLMPTQQFLLRNVRWETYEAILQALGDRPNLRITYDGENLELMTISALHEFFKKMLGRLIEAMTLELAISIRSGGQLTCRREDVERGLEPDQCYWIAHESAVRKNRQLDFTVDPVPDLALEIDVSASSLNRQSIYARLRVPEIWRFDGERIYVFVLQENGEYEPSETSAAFPFLPVQELVPFLEPDEEEGETGTMRRFLEWIREQDFASAI